ncbi:MAG: hypothetical protein PWP34_1818 [Desulfuromonadales bacterium]|nr:hypothetical protein [Desulfuromonadales bacterium]
MRRLSFRIEKPRSAISGRGFFIRCEKEKAVCLAPLLQLQHGRVASRQTPSSFCLPKKRKQKKGTPLLARLRRVPSTVRPPGGRKRFAALSFPPVSPVARSVPAASQGGKPVICHWALGLGPWALGLGPWALGLGPWALGLYSTLCTDTHNIPAADRSAGDCDMCRDALHKWCSGGFSDRGRCSRRWPVVPG